METQQETSNLQISRLIGLKELARRLSTREGRSVNPSTLWRWRTKGVRLPDGSVVRLECIRVGGKWGVTEEAIEDFLEAQRPKQQEETNISPQPGRPRTTAGAHTLADQIQRSAMANAECEKLGF